MTWLWAVALSLAVSVLVASRVRARGEFPHDRRFDDIDGEGPQ